MTEEDERLRSLVRQWVEQAPDADAMAPGPAPTVGAKPRSPGCTQEDIDAGNGFFAQYRHAVCRDGASSRDGTLMDVCGTRVYLRGRDGLEFVCCVRDLIVLEPPPPALYQRVRYTGKEDPAMRMDGQLTELWALAKGDKLAIVQPAARAAWFALLSDLEWVECPLPMGLVSGWSDPPFGPAGEERA